MLASNHNSLGEKAEVVYYCCVTVNLFAPTTTVCSLCCYQLRPTQSRPLPPLLPSESHDPMETIRWSIQPQPKPFVCCWQARLLAKNAQQAALCAACCSLAARLALIPLTY